MRRQRKRRRLASKLQVRDPAPQCTSAPTLRGSGAAHSAPASPTAFADRRGGPGTSECLSPSLLCTLEWLCSHAGLCTFLVKREPCNPVPQPQFRFTQYSLASQARAEVFPKRARNLAARCPPRSTIHPSPSAEEAEEARSGSISEMWSSDSADPTPPVVRWSGTALA